MQQNKGRTLQAEGMCVICKTVERVVKMASGVLTWATWRTAMLFTEIWGVDDNRA